MPARLIIMDKELQEGGAACSEGKLTFILSPLNCPHFQHWWELPEIFESPRPTEY